MKEQQNLIYPKDSPTRKTDSKSSQILHSQINTDHWLLRLETGNDVGRDCILELSENDEWHNHKIEGQIKGTAKPTLILDEQFVSFPLEVKTLNYAINSPISFILFVIDVTEKKVYYQCLQDYYKMNKEKIDKIKPDQNTYNIRLDVKNVLNADDSALQELAKKIHIINH